MNYFLHYKRWNDGSHKNYSSVIPLYTRIFNLDKLSKESKILDYGCGIGLLINTLLLKGFKNVKGVDISKEQIEQAKIKNLPCELINSYNDVKEYETYDYIFLIDVLEHIPKEEQIEVLKYLRSLLVKNGKLFISVPNANSTFSNRWLFIDWTHFTAYTESSLEFLLLNASFEKLAFLPYEFIKRPKFPIIIRPAVFYWLLRIFFRVIRRLQAVSELGEEGWRLPFSLNLLVCAEK
jgi:2-polyprenyl-3-methyl-5-hydroxy-6-metoxy-1,4-benzoquinol methylase